MFHNNSNPDFVNITVSVPRNGFNSFHNNNQSSQQVVPGNDYNNSDFTDEGIVPSPTSDPMERESFYDEFFGCVKKTPDGARFKGYGDYNNNTQKYHLSSTGELKKLKERVLKNGAGNNSYSQCARRLHSPWRLIIDEEDLVTSSPVYTKPIASKGVKKRDPEGFRRMLRKAGWKNGIFPG